MQQDVRRFLARVVGLGVAGGLTLLGVPAPASQPAPEPDPPPVSVPPPDGVPTAATEHVAITSELSGVPTGVAVREAPGGGYFVAAKRGDVLRYDGPSDATPTIVVRRSAATHSTGDRGMLGLEVDPQFATGRPYLYVLYMDNRDPFGTDEVPRWYTGTTDVCPQPPGLTLDGCTVTARLERVTVGVDGLEVPGSAVTLLDGASDTVGGWCFQYPSHGIGTVRFGPDGMLYVGAGDGASFNTVDHGQLGGRMPDTPTPANPCDDAPGERGTPLEAADSVGGALRSQAPRAATGEQYVSWSGSILRVDPDTGHAPPDNPLVDNGIAGDDRVVAYGLRNPFRFNFAEGTDQLWIGDVGWATHEEINRFTAGPGQSSVPNFGWPCYEGGEPQPGYDGAQIGLCESLYGTGEDDLGGVPSPLVDPLFTWDHTDGAQVPTAGCASRGGEAAVGGVVLRGEQWPPRLRGAYVFADYARGCIAFLEADEHGDPDPSRPHLLVSGTAATDLQVGADGSLYWPDLMAGDVKRLRPDVTGNLPPMPAFTATPGAGPLPLHVSFDASTTEDPEGEPLTLTWDLDGDDECGDATGVEVSHTYDTGGPVVVTLCASDASGAQARISRTVRPGAVGPERGPLTANVRAGGYRIGDRITVTAPASADGVPLPASAYHWEFELRHCDTPEDATCHTHILDQVDGVKYPRVTAPDHEYYSFVRARLTVEGSYGASASGSLDLRPRSVAVTVHTRPKGIEVTNGPANGHSPLTASYAWGALVGLSAPRTVTVRGVRYRFDRWADGVTKAERDLLAPRTDTSRTALYLRE